MEEISEEKSLPPSSIDVSSKEAELRNVARHNFDSLPNEILLKILKFLDGRSLCRCSQVNKRLNRLAQDPFLYTSLNLDQLHGSINVDVLNYLAPRCPHLRCLILTNCSNYVDASPAEFKNFFDVCGNSLTDLSLRFSDFGDGSVLQEMLLLCRNLRKLELKFCDVSDNGFGSLMALDSLERFETFATSIEQETLIRIIQGNPKIRYLDLRHLRYTNVDAVARTIADSCPDLESLIWPSTRISGVGIRELARCTSLRHLDIASCLDIFTPDGGPNGQRALETLFGSCINLQTVMLASVYYFLDEDLEPLLSCPIEELDLTEALHITADMCSRFFRSWPRLRKINLRNCRQIRYTDVQKWRRHYPRVSIGYEAYSPTVTSFLLRRFGTRSPYANACFGYK